MRRITIEEYLSKLSPDLQAITKEMCTVARQNMPGAHEGKRMRHVKVRSVEDAKDPALGKLIAATWKESPASIAKIHAGHKKNKSRI